MSSRNRPSSPIIDSEGSTARSPFTFPFQPVHEVASGQQPRHVDSGTPEAVFDGDRFKIEPQPSDATGKIRLKEMSGCDRAPEAPTSQAGRDFGMAGVEIVHEGSHHAHAVLDLRKFTVMVPGRNGLTGQDIEFVAQEHERRIPLVEKTLLNRVEASNRVGRVFGCHRIDARQVFTMIGQTDRDDSHRLDGRITPGQIVDGAIEMRAVVPTRTQHHLAMQLDAGGGQAVELPIESVVGVVPQHPRSNMAFGGVDRYIERRQPLIDNALQFGFGDIGQGEVVPEQERQAIVFVLDTQGPPRVAGILMDETENAIVVANQGLDRFELGAHALPLVPDKFQYAVPGTDGHRLSEIRQFELKIDDVQKRLTVDFDDFVAGAQADTARQRMRLDLQNADRHFGALFCGRGMAVFMLRPNGALHVQIVGLSNVGARREWGLGPVHLILDQFPAPGHVLDTGYRGQQTRQDEHKVEGVFTQVQPVVEQHQEHGQQLKRRAHLAVESGFEDPETVHQVKGEAAEQNEGIPKNDDHHQPKGDRIDEAHPGEGKHDDGAADQQFVRNRIEDGAHRGLLTESARDQAVERVGHRGHHEDGQSGAHAVVDDQGDEDGNENDPEDRQLVRQGQYVRAVPLDWPIESGRLVCHAMYGNRMPGKASGSLLEMLDIPGLEIPEFSCNAVLLGNDRNIDIQRLPRTEAVGLRTEEIHQFTGYFVRAGTGRLDPDREFGHVDVVDVGRIRIQGRRHHTRFGQRQAVHGLQIELHRGRVVDQVAIAYIQRQRHLTGLSGNHVARRVVGLDHLRQAASRRHQLRHRENESEGKVHHDRLHPNRRQALYRALPERTEMAKRTEIVRKV